MKSFAVGIPTLNRYDLLDRCIHTVLHGTVTPSVIFVIDNGQSYEIKYPNVTVVSRPPCNIGVAASWNLLHRLADPLPLVIFNDDVVPPMDVCERLLNDPHRIAFAIGWAAFRQDHSLWRELGDYDEFFYPAYYEDSDYSRRLTLAGIERGELHVPTFHHMSGASTSKLSVEQRMRMQARTESNRDYYLRKWGGPPEAEQFTTPFNTPPTSN